jgi:hypothetical protein
MTTTEVRNYSCKDEELTVISRYVLISFRRDINDFSAFSPVFNQDYVNNFNGKIERVEELVSPKFETNDLKQITKRLYLAMDNLTDPIIKTRSYLTLTKDTIGLSAKDFGLSLLSRKISSKDAEGVHQNLLLVNAHIQKYWEQLKAAGFSDSLAEQFKNAVASIRDDNQLQYDILTKRKAIVQNNRNLLNELYSQLTEILNVGKALYRKTNPVKTKEYTFTSLVKNVRIVEKKETKW